MLSLAKIGRGREEYHLSAVGHGASMYYSERGEVAGVWMGIERSVIDAFSKRGDEILNALPEVAERLNQQRLLLGLSLIDPDSRDALDIASHQTRARKLSDSSTEELRRGWGRRRPASD